ncbi:N-acetylmuramoyl-L-alanine amidase [Reinekea marina]|uniref:N-acetylmuramoyl-L-alanine amidase n=1 Tax=Reinekea marina TaxID=1310421 RepID=A0ABV7WN08_9GAMM|nr:N-acetylmuramoyl-L-alanine amidase [Reinekea marina]MBU2864795.1 N-acetylmuramoyl-L-alanine amidase [Reinekea forsetii]MDN3648632.1 N-acetylmuramoyl-L-alanine amidase [Reinekea marina]
MFRGVICACLLSLCSVFAQATTMEGARIWPSPDVTRLVLDLSGPVEHSILVLKNPDRVVLDVKNTSLKGSLDHLDLADTGVRLIRSAKRNNNDLRIVLDMTESMSPRSFNLPPNEQYGHRLVVDLERPVLSNTGEKVVPTPTVNLSVDQVSNQRRDILVVIDAGHGGEDPGAVGPNKTLEKHVVLAIAKQVYQQLEARQGYKPLLVRNGDYIVALKNRRNFAREKNADIFVSIHADAFSSASARGASVYALSNGGATSSMAQYLADQENAADVIGGLNGVSLEDKDDVLKQVLVDLSMTATMQSSLNVGALVLEEIGRFTKLHGNRRVPGQANFVVLRAPDVPSILVETGYISNPIEEANLGSPAYRKKMATAITNGIVRYFESQPPEGSWVAWKKQQSQSVKKYVVAKGDTLSGIAVKNGVSLQALKSINNISGSTIKIGQVLILPQS